jgi:hypothetical protein
MDYKPPAGGFFMAMYYTNSSSLGATHAYRHHIDCLHFGSTLYSPIFWRYSPATTA